MEKQYVAGKLTSEQFSEQLTGIGLTDDVDADRLVWALNVIRDYGAALPSEPTNGTRSPETDKATDAQLALIADLVQKHKLTAPDLPLTKADASAIITDMKAGTYDAAKWAVPF
jgi:hypothetical protein